MAEDPYEYRHALRHDDDYDDEDDDEDKDVHAILRPDAVPEAGELKDNAKDKVGEAY